MAEYDLTDKISLYLDRHLIFPLLEYISAKNIYNERDILETKLRLLSGTSMIDYATDIHIQLHGAEPEDHETKRNDAVKRLEALELEIEPVFQVFNKQVMERLANCRDTVQLTTQLEEEYNFQPEMCQLMYTYAKEHYDCGGYARSADVLYIVRALVSPTDKMAGGAMWGKLASEILTQNWEVALEDLQKLKDFLDQQVSVPPLHALQQRTWLLHWSLFIFFNHPKGKDFLIEWFLQNPQNLNALQTLAPHLLRYVAACVIINSRKRKQVLKDMIKVIQQESYTYRDPITEFLECLYVNFDFDSAQQKLRVCEVVLNNDFFLVACNDDFIDSARLMIFETFCRIHQCISIKMLAEKLNMKDDEAERWIVNLIRNARLDAKIDSRLGHVVMGTQAIPPYQIALEKTKNLIYKSQIMLMSVEKKLGLRNPDLWSQE